MEKGKRHHLQSALGYVQQGKLDRAIAEYEAILRADPADCNVLNALGDLCARTGNKADAIGYFMRLGEAYRLDGLYVRAVAVYKKMLKLDPSNAEASLACGDLYAEQGLIAEAKLQFQGLADHYVRRGDMASALDMFEKMIQIDPGHHPTLHKLAGILVRPGGVENALSRLDALRERLIVAGQADDARQIYKKAVELLRSQGREAEAARFAAGLNSLGPLEGEAGTAEGALAAFGEDGDSLGLSEMAAESSTPLEIMPGSGVDSQELLSFDEPDMIGKLELERVKAESHSGPEERMGGDGSIYEEAGFLGGGEPGPIQLDLSEGFAGLGAIPGEAAEDVELVGSQTPDDELQEAKFFMEQGMLQEARAILHRILRRDPEHRQAKQHLAEIEGSEAAPPMKESPRPEVKKPSVFRVTEAKAPPEVFVDLAGELSKELSHSELSAPTDLEPEVQHLLHQLDEGIRDQLDVTDYETHYNLGLAYRDLELYEKAIAEFRLAANDASYRVRCASLLGLCYMAKGDPERSVEELLKGLSAAKAASEERWGILYDLATAYEASGDMGKSLETLATIHSEAPKFRDIRVRIRDLRARVDKGRGTPR